MARLAKQDKHPPQVEIEDSLPRLIGERLCLDFADTIAGRTSGRPEEFLRGYPDLARWARHAGAISDAEARRLSAEAGRRPGDGAAVLGRALLLREAIHDIFAAIARAQSPRAADLERLQEEYLAGLARARLGPANDGYDWLVEPVDTDAATLDRLLWPVARSAVELLTSPEVARVRECPGAGDCGSLFLDTSKNGTRRWCSMDRCGSRVKMRRHYARTKAKAARASSW